jgi:hypothetical protein
MLRPHAFTGEVQVLGGLEDKVLADRRRSWFYGSSDSKNFFDKRIQFASGANLHEGFEGVAFHLEASFQYDADCSFPFFRHRATLLEPHLICDRGLIQLSRTGSLPCDGQV